MRKGFTLIELLVVIAVIAILMGILMPVLGKARKQARGAACMGQLKQWGLIWNMYCQDYNYEFPNGTLRSSGELRWPRGIWITSLRANWEKHPKLLLCPSARKDSGTDHGGVETSYVMGNYLDIDGNQAVAERASYGINCWAYSTQIDIQGRKAAWHWKRLDKVRNPSMVPLFLDAMWRGGGPYWEFTKAIYPPRKNGQWIDYDCEMMHFALDRHLRGVNGLFMDFSVRKVPVRELWELKWHRTFDTKKVLEQDDSWWGPWLRDY